MLGVIEIIRDTLEGVGVWDSVTKTQRGVAKVSCDIFQKFQALCLHLSMFSKDDFGKIKM